jgi:hypothetical protein
MGRRLKTLIDQVRAKGGPFLVARLALKVDFNVSSSETEDDTPAREQAVLRACRDMGVDVDAALR